MFAIDTPNGMQHIDNDDAFTVSQDAHGLWRWTGWGPYKGYSSIHHPTEQAAINDAIATLQSIDDASTATPDFSALA